MEAPDERDSPGSDAGGPYDVITLGRIGVDLYPGQSGVTLDQVETFHRFLGGTATNVAVAAARLGRRSAIVTKVGDDPFGFFIRRALAEFGVDNRFVATHPTLRTPIVFCELHPPDSFPLLFYREPRAPDMTIAREELDFVTLGEAKIVWTTGTGLAEEPSREATLAALEAATGVAIHDLDYRPMFWPEPEAAREQQLRALRAATISIGNLEECSVAVGDGTPEEMADRLLALGLEMAVIKRGPHGVSAFTPDEQIHIPPVEVTVVNGLGAGDAFGGALCHGILAGWPLGETLAFANAAGAHVASQLACADAMPDETTVRRLMETTEMRPT